MNKKTLSITAKQKAFLLLFFLCILALSFFALNWTKEIGFKSLRAEARRPEKIRSVADSLAVFNDPLPGVFQWRSGFSMPFSKNLSVINSAPFMLISIASEQNLWTGLEPLDKSIELGSRLGNDLSYQKWRLLSEGKLPVAAHYLKYSLGEVAVGDHKVQELRGSVLLPDKTVSFDVFGQIDKQFNLAQFQIFLDCINKFK